MKPAENKNSFSLLLFLLLWMFSLNPNNIGFLLQCIVELNDTIMLASIKLY